MHALRRQLRIWANELFTAWGKIPFYGRLVLGAAISLWMAMHFVNTSIKPLNTSIASLQKDLVVPENLNIETDEEIIMNNDRADSLKTSVSAWQKRVNHFKENAVALKSENHLTILADIQKALLECNHMELVSERVYDPIREAQELARKMGRRVEAPKVGTATGHKALGVWQHQYHVHGTFRQIQAFFGLLNMMDWRFDMSKIQLRTHENSRHLDLNFILTIYYLND